MSFASVKFWNFFVGEDEIDPENTDLYNSVYDMKYKASSRKFTYSSNARFIKERKDRVLKAKEELN